MQKKVTLLVLGPLLAMAGCGARSSLFDTPPETTPGTPATCTPVNDNEPCTDDICEGGVPVHVPTEAGTPCSASGAICVDSACVEPACTAVALPNPPVSFPGPKLSALAVGDFDGDHRLDIAVTSGDSTSSVLWGQGNGVFAPGSDLATGLAPSAVAAADLNSDGIADLAVANQKGWGVSVILSQGNGAFSSTVDYDVGSAGSIAAADLDGDGAPDLALGLSPAGAGGVVVLRNQGNGQFGPAIPYEVGAAVTSIVATDLNGDGHPDLAFTSGGVRVLLNQGDGNLGAAVQYDAGVEFSSVVTADVNGDGHPDLVGAERIPVPAGIPGMSIFLNQGDGTLAPAVHYDASGEELSYSARLSSIAALDLNGDGNTDLAAANTSNSLVSVVLNQGDGTFAAPTEYDVPFHNIFGTILATADLNDDGKPDLAVAAPVIGEHSIVATLLSQGDGTLPAPVSYPGEFRDGTTADLNGDGKLDVITVTADDTIEVSLNQGNGTLGAPVSYSAASFPGLVAATDLNGDGKPDIVIEHGLNILDSGVDVLINLGDGTFGSPVAVLEEDPRPWCVVVMDWNGDGKPDLAYSHKNPNSMAGHMSVVLNEGNATFTAPIPLLIDDPPFCLFVAKDLNGDGKTDLAYVYDDPIGDSGVKVLLNEGNDVFAPALDYALSKFKSVDPRNIEATDLNGDGKSDLVVLRHGDGVSVLLNQGDGTFSAPVNYAAKNMNGQMEVADLNGDDRPDLIIGYDYVINVLLNQGDGTFPAALAYLAYPYPFAIETADLDDDSRIDVLLWGSHGMTVLFNQCLP